MALTNYVIGTTAHPGSTTSIQDAMTQEGYRYLDLAMLMEGATGASQLSQARPGVLTAGSLDATSQIPNAMAATAAGSGLSINIARGAAIVERGTPDGPYLVSVFSNGQVTLGTADATNSRIDRVDLQVLDGSQGDNGGTSQTAYIVTQGIASGTPATPAPPVDSIPICTVLLPANTITVTSGMITKTRKSSAVRGAVRVLLEGDSLSDAGMHVGELRDTSVISPSSPTIDRWNTHTVAWERVIDLLRVQAHYTDFPGSQPINNITTAGYSAVVDGSGNSVGHAFVAPASGIVKLEWGASAFSGTNGSTLMLGVAVRTGATVGSGTIQSNVSDDEAMFFSLINSAPGSRVRLVTGLTPGSSYNVQQSARNTGSTSSPIFRPWVVSSPVAN